MTHGLIESPASRNQFCGVITKVHEIGTPQAQYPECGPAFTPFDTMGYSFMSVLNHHRGRLRPLPPLAANETPPPNEANGTIPPLADNVCGYDAETFGNGATPWDEPIDWPTNNMSSGRNKFTWNISWGPHFNDTAEFHYWITKPTFNFEVGKRLSWSDFDDQPFCKLQFDPNNFSANPNIVARVDDSKFDTFCDIPDRNGRHVIYGEWGRNYFTWERFHGCVDVEFNNQPIVDAKITTQPTGSLFDAGSIIVDGSESSGSELNYSWLVASQTTDASYNFDNASNAVSNLTFTKPSAPGTVTVKLVVTSNDQSSTALTTIDHLLSDNNSVWQFQRILTDSKQLNIGDAVQVRVVLADGQDRYFPPAPLFITATNTNADTWPLTLAQTVNSDDNPIAIGILNSNEQIIPVLSATENNIYSRTDTEVASVFLDIKPATQSAQCRYEIVSEWDSGLVANVVIANQGSLPINGWAINWQYNDGTRVDTIWNANTSGDSMASHLSWNATIAPSQSVSVGFQATKASAQASIPTITGDVCD